MSDETKRKVLVIPCSGIGKALGSVAREAAYRVVEDLRPDVAGITCLSLLVMGDEETRRTVAEHACIAIDGCQKACARKNIELGGGQVRRAFQVMEALRDHKGLKLGTVLDIGDDGRTLAAALAQSVAEEIDAESDANA